MKDYYNYIYLSESVQSVNTVVKKRRIVRGTLIIRTQTLKFIRRFSNEIQKDIPGSL